MMKRGVIISGTIAFIFAFTLPAWAVSLNSSFPVEKNGYDFEPLLTIETEALIPPDTHRPAILPVISENFYKIIFSDHKVIDKYTGHDLEPKNHGSDGAAPVPEPATLVLLGSGLIGLTFLGRRKKKSMK